MAVDGDIFYSLTPPENETLGYVPEYARGSGW